MAIRLYLDTNILCRPFDDQTIRRIRRETEAFGRILERIRGSEAILITSEILVFELQKILSPSKRAKASGYLPLAKDHHLLKEGSFLLAEEILQQYRLEPRDALHIASAILEESDYFLSCDDGVTKRFKKNPLSVTIKGRESVLEVMNPIDFVKRIGW